jgi:hypothetical protein
MPGLAAILVLMVLLLLILDQGIPNTAEKIGITLVAYARRVRRHQRERARRQDELLLRFLERAVKQ